MTLEGYTEEEVDKMVQLIKPLYDWLKENKDLRYFAVVVNGLIIVDKDRFG